MRTAALKTDIAAFGRVEQPEAQLAAVSARIGGRVDKLYVQYTGERVRSGQPVADIYSPEVATAIEEYRLARENRNGLRQSDDPYARTQADALVKASQHKLELWGITEKQMVEPGTEGVPHVTIYAYASGTVVDRKVTQGQYVNAGDTLFTVADLSQVWIKADVYEEQLPQIRQGQEVDITAESLPGRTLHGHVDFIEPAANPQTRTVPVHVHVGNPGMHLLPGMFVGATFVSHAAEPSIVVPRSAVLDTGLRKLVYLARPNGVFEAREVKWAWRRKTCFRYRVDWRWATRWCSTATSSSTRRLTSAQACPVFTADRRSLPAASRELLQPRAAGNSAEAPAAQLEFHADSDPLKAGEDNEFHAKLTGADGKPISDAQVTSDAGDAGDALDGHAGDEEFLCARVGCRQASLHGKRTAGHGGNLEHFRRGAARTAKSSRSARTHISAR